MIKKKPTDPKDIPSRVERWADTYVQLRGKIKELSEVHKQCTDSLKKVVAESSNKDEKGNHFIETPCFLVTNQERRTIRLNAERAMQLLQSKNLVNEGCTLTVDADKIEKLHLDGKLTDTEILGVSDTTTTVAIDVKEKK